MAVGEWAWANYRDAVGNGINNNSIVQSIFIKCRWAVSGSESVAMSFPLMALIFAERSRKRC